MSEDRRKILEMVSQGKITVVEAEALLSALNAKATQGSEHTFTSATGSRALPKYLRVEVDSKEEGKNQKVNIKVPFQLLRAGVKLAAFMPKDAQSHVSHALEKKGISFDLNSLKPESLEEFISQLGDLTVDVDGGNEKVRIYCE